jgi:hypothetical protein
MLLVVVGHFKMKKFQRILSGKINMIQEILSFGIYDYELLSLHLIRPSRYKGAISKSMDGWMAGKHGKKYLNLFPIIILMK